MAPRKQRTMEEIYETDNARMQQQIAALTEQIAALTVAFQQPPLNTHFTEEEEERSAAEDEENPFARDLARRRDRRPTDTGSHRWEAGLKIDLPEFHGTLQPEEFLDWLFSIEEILEFKEVPENKRVPLVATRFRGRAAAWWQQSKVTRLRHGKKKIDSWDKMKKHMRVAFLPHNYTRTLYQNFQNLRQGAKTVEEYTTEFYQLLARNDLGETEEQLVSRYIGGLQIAYQETLNFFDPYSVSEAHQKALQAEKQAKRRLGNYGGASGSNRNTTQSGINRGTIQVGNLPVVPQNRNPIATSGPRCFKCGEPGHRIADCKKAGPFGKGLFMESEEIVGDEFDVSLQDPVFDSEHEQVVSEEHVMGDDGPLLVVRRACYTPREAKGDSWLRNNIFQSTCTIGGKVCRLVIDSGSCENVIAEEAVKKLALSTEKHPNPYKLSWLQKGKEVTVSERCLVSFSIGSHYKDKVWCDVVRMDACHILLGRPWQFDRDV
ncbi:uncharacterized protein LOC131302299 [Rhododendron vialii]|uniref:uncharacterized protein LOC131302299 n=1 Tax=Rhododendron vialii TaxID=182163 RepID=UPI00265FBFD3|nr:uncharacterized protein LOC131302299 [Rhododendron vialii]